MSTLLQEDLDVIPQTIPHIRRAHREGGASNKLVVETDLDGPLRFIEVQMSNAYIEKYPVGEVSFVAGDVFHVLGCDQVTTVATLCQRIVETCLLMHEVPLDMGGQEASSWARAASAELITPPTGCQTGFTSGIHAQLLADMNSSTVGGLQFVDHSALGLITATLEVPLTTLSAMAADAWEVIKDEPLKVSITFDRNRYLDKGVRVEVGQDRNFNERNFQGLPGQMKLIVQRFCDAHQSGAAHYLPLIAAGYLMDDVVATSAGFCTVPSTAALATKLKAIVDTAENEGRSFQLGSLGFFDQLKTYVLQRLRTLSSYCAICDRALEAGSLMRLSVCNRPVCCFRMEELDVGKTFGFAAAMQAGIVDLLINFAKTAALHARWELIFNPFPMISSNGRELYSPERKKECINEIREIFKAMPATYMLLGKGTVMQQLHKAHPQAAGLFQWVVSSNKSHLVKLDPQLQFSFMTTPHQFIIAMSSDDRVEKFEALKRQYGSVWAYHGSSGENWHSILRNGLKNASGTKLQVNGTAYGNGVYLSPSAATSFAYSHIAQTEGSNPYASRAPTTAPEAKQFIQMEGMSCIAICEVIDKDIRKSGTIWVQPDEVCVIARYFFVYGPGDSRGDADLTQQDKLRILRERSDSLITR